MNKDKTIITRVEPDKKLDFESFCEGIAKPSHVMRELIGRFNSDPKLRNSVRVSIELKTKTRT